CPRECYSGCLHSALPISIDRAVFAVTAEQHLVAESAEPDIALQIGRAVAGIAERTLGAVIAAGLDAGPGVDTGDAELVGAESLGDRKSTRLNSSHVKISY